MLRWINLNLIHSFWNLICKTTIECFGGTKNVIVKQTYIRKKKHNTECLLIPDTDGSSRKEVQQYKFVFSVYKISKKLLDKVMEYTNIT